MLVKFKLTNLIKSTIPVLNTLSIMKFVIKNHKKNWDVASYNTDAAMPVKQQ